MEFIRVHVIFNKFQDGVCVFVSLEFRFGSYEYVGVVSKKYNVARSAGIAKVIDVNEE